MKTIMHNLQTLDYYGNISKERSSNFPVSTRLIFPDGEINTKTVRTYLRQSIASAEEETLQEVITLIHKHELLDVTAEFLQLSNIVETQEPTDGLNRFDLWSIGRRLPLVKKWWESQQA